MKKFFFIAAMVSAALISCTKNEPAPSMDAQQEITFMTAPLTKATITEFGAANRFRTWAFHDQANWTAGSTTAQLYLGGDAGLEIQKIDGVWKNDTQSYYWPKTGKLTFYSYSLNTTGTFLTDATVACTNAGITVTGYDIQKNLDVDFLVADQAANKTANVNTYYTEGVPTLFRHRLSNIIFKVQTADDYAGKTFILESITLNNVAKTANYTQAAGEPANDVWAHGTTTNILFSNDASSFSKTNVLTPVAEQSYYIPDTFAEDNETVTIVYNVTTNNGSGTSTEKVTVTKSLKEIFGSWDKGNKYTCTITVSLNEILWDPAVEEWTLVEDSWAI